MIFFQNSNSGRNFCIGAENARQFQFFADFESTYNLISQKQSHCSGARVFAEIMSISVVHFSQISTVVTPHRLRLCLNLCSLICFCLTEGSSQSDVEVLKTFLVVKAENNEKDQKSS